MITQNEVPGIIANGLPELRKDLKDLVHSNRYG